MTGTREEDALCEADMKMKFDYFYGKESDMMTFYRIPKILIMDDYFEKMDNEAKLLYGLLLDRMSLSAKNGWYDEDKKVYIYYTQKSLMKDLHRGKNKVSDMLTELEKYGLIERIKGRRTVPDKIYVKIYVDQKKERSKNIVSRFENQTTEQHKNAVDNTVKSVENPINTEVAEKRKDNMRVEHEASRFEIQPSRLPDLNPCEVCDSTPNNTENNKTNISETESNQISSMESREDTMRFEATAYGKLIRENLAVDAMVERDPDNADMYEGIYELVYETVISQNEYIVIASNRYPMDLVKSKFLKLDSTHIDYVVASLKSNTSKIRNIKKYMLAALFNAPTTISSYYQAEVNNHYPNYAS